MLVVPVDAVNTFMNHNANIEIDQAGAMEGDYLLRARDMEGVVSNPGLSH